MAEKITKENFLDAKYDVFRKFSEQWAIVSAGKIDDYNCMTLSWGMLGNVWEHPGAAVTIYVRPDRYTFEFMEKNDYFVISFLPEKNRKDAELLGTLSGRDGDKFAATGLTVAKTAEGTPYPAEANLVLVCRKLYADDLKENAFIDPEMLKHYAAKDYHRFYICEITEVLVKDGE